MTSDQIIAEAKKNNWTRKQTREAMYRANDPALWSQRDAVLIALGFAPTGSARPFGPVFKESKHEDRVSIPSGSQMQEAKRVVLVGVKRGPRGGDPSFVGNPEWVAVNDLPAAAKSLIRRSYSDMICGLTRGSRYGNKDIQACPRVLAEAIVR